MYIPDIRYFKHWYNHFLQEGPPDLQNKFLLGTAESFPILTLSYDDWEPLCTSWVLQVQRPSWNDMCLKQPVRRGRTYAGHVNWQTDSTNWQTHSSKQMETGSLRSLSVLISFNLASSVGGESSSTSATLTPCQRWRLWCPSQRSLACGRWVLRGQRHGPWTGWPCRHSGRLWLRLGRKVMPAR